MKQRQFKTNQNEKPMYKDKIYVELQLLCRCLPLSLVNNDAMIQFTRRYLQCQSAMPIRAIRLLIEKLLVHSPHMQISIFDRNNRLLKDTDRLSSLMLSSNCISLYFTMINTITSFPHCSCLYTSNESDLSETITSTNIDAILSTCDIAQSQTLTLLPLRSIQPPTSDLNSIRLPLRKDKRFRLSEDTPLDLSMKNDVLLSDINCVM